MDLNKTGWLAINDSQSLAPGTFSSSSLGGMIGSSRQAILRRVCIWRPLAKITELLLKESIFVV